MRLRLKPALILGMTVLLGACSAPHPNTPLFADQAVVICSCTDMACVKAASEAFQKKAPQILKDHNGLAKKDKQAINASVKESKDCVSKIAKKGAPPKR